MATYTSAFTGAQIDSYLRKIANGEFATTETTSTLENSISSEINRATTAENTKVNKSGDTMTGSLSAPSFATGSDTNNYLQSQKFRGEGNAATYYHAIDFGYSGHNQVDFYEYGGVWNFWKNTTATATTDTANRVISFELGKLVERGNTLTYPGKSGTIATIDDIKGSIYSGSGTPALTPAKYPAIYVDTSTQVVYYCLSGNTWVATVAVYG